MSRFSKSLASICLGFWLLSTPAVDAADITRSSKLATELTELMQVRQIASGYLAQCSKQEGSYLDPKQIFSSDPGLFGGISPQSAYWPEVVELYGSYQKRACSAVSADKFVSFFAQEYEAKLSENELEAAVAYFSSASGRRYNAVSAETNLAFQRYVAKEMTTVVGVAFKEVQEELRAISARYKKDPR